MKASMIVASMAAGVAATAQVNADVVSAFESFAAKYDKTYSPEEWARRIAVFAENLERVKEMNAEHILKGGEAVHGITQFSDMTPEEFKQIYLNYIPSEVPEFERVTPAAIAGESFDIDWRDNSKTVLTPVKDQGRCGSCWAFSAVEAIESYWALNADGNAIIDLSEQQVNSCDKIDGGCNGGNTEVAYNYIIRAGGLVTEAEYPYESGHSGSTYTCNKTAEAMPKSVKISGFKSVTAGESNMRAAIQAGPVSVCLAAESFQTYTSGILRVCRGRTDHCVQAVGYNENGGDAYWIVRNSWGSSWGEKGFIRVAYGSDLCYIADDVTYPLF